LSFHGGLGDRASPECAQDVPGEQDGVPVVSVLFLNRVAAWTALVPGPGKAVRAVR
jgi:hypothetical protein